MTSPACAPGSAYLRDLGVDAIWFTPWYPSPLADGGYDVPTTARSTRRSATWPRPRRSSARRWRSASARSSTSSPTTSRPSTSGSRRRSPPAPDRRSASASGSAPARAETATRCRPTGSRTSRATTWTRTTNPDGTPGEWYLHLFTPEQPDLNWNHPDVRHASTRTCCGSGSTAASPACASTPRRCSSRIPRCPRCPRTRARASTRTPTATRCTTSTASWRAIADSYQGTRVLVGEVWMPDTDALRRLPAPRRDAHRVQLRLHGAAVGRRRAARVDRPDARGARAGRRAVHLGALEPRRDPAGHPLRPGGQLVRVRDQALRHPDRSRARHPPRTGRRAADRGAARARSTSTRATSSACPRSRTCRRDCSQDPMHFRSNGVDPGRDGCRVPLPWSGTAPAVRLQPAAGVRRAALAAAAGRSGRRSPSRRRSTTRTRCCRSTGQPSRIRASSAALGDGTLSWLAARAGRARLHPRRRVRERHEPLRPPHGPARARSSPAQQRREPDRLAGSPRLHGVAAHR